MTIQEYLSWFDDVLETTASMYRLVPPDKLDWKPTEKSFSLGQLIEHIAKALWFNSKVIASKEWPLKSLREIFVSNRRQTSATPDEALRHLDEYSSGFKRAVRDLGDERFQHGNVNTPQWGTLPIWRFAVFVLEHHINHKMELHMYLKILGMKVNTGTLYAVKKPSAKSPSS
jgi:uncharacterized damage-inducible protein DinB